ncbi:hypothetical protein GLOIN_2v1569580 [Rhizophagus clarus]|uniref:Uncharacterized protein n=1 Tax=Rhizophagus clarus TaxID=94130 RepID=A0A8H3QTC8_9GLOM|nr:hypothetical protein GLOIN_2v1569580 [Rhizophagus clarus]
MIGKELKFGVFLIYGALIAQGHLFYWNPFELTKSYILIKVIDVYPNLDKEFEYSNDLDNDDDYDEDDEEEEKDEKISEKLNRYWKFFKISFYDAFIF